jgi:hypothetical protein
MYTKKSIRELEHEIREPLTRLMGIINTHYCDVATPNDVFEIRDGKYQLIKTIYTDEV